MIVGSVGVILMTDLYIVLYERSMLHAGREEERLQNFGWKA
jgi:hypothetical protein